MAASIRRTWGRITELDRALRALNWGVWAFLFGSVGSAKLAAGTTAGKIKTVADIDFRIGGRIYSKAATDDLWNLSGETTLGAGVYKAAILYLDASGTATYTLTAAATSAALALRAVGDLTLGGYVSTKSVIGVYVSTAAQNWGSGGLGGTYYNGIPEAAYSSSASDGAAGYITFENV